MPFFDLLCPSAFPPLHCHQVVEALMCMFSKDVKTQRVKYTGDGPNTDTIRGDVACRHSSDHDWQTLKANGCVPKNVNIKAKR